LIHNSDSNKCSTVLYERSATALSSKVRERISPQQCVRWTLIGLDGAYKTAICSVYEACLNVERQQWKS